MSLGRDTRIKIWDRVRRRQRRLLLGVPVFPHLEWEGEGKNQLANNMEIRGIGCFEGRCLNISFVTFYHVRIRDPNLELAKHMCEPASKKTEIAIIFAEAWQCLHILVTRMKKNYFFASSSFSQFIWESARAVFRRCLRDECRSSSLSSD